MKNFWSPPLDGEGEGGVKRKEDCKLANGHFAMAILQFSPSPALPTRGGSRRYSLIKNDFDSDPSTPMKMEQDHSSETPNSPCRPAEPSHGPDRGWRCRRGAGWGCARQASIQADGGGVRRPQPALRRPAGADDPRRARGLRNRSGSSFAASGCCSSRTWSSRLAIVPHMTTHPAVIVAAAEVFRGWGATVDGRRRPRPRPRHRDGARRIGRAATRSTRRSCRSPISTIEASPGEPTAAGSASSPGFYFPAERRRGRLGRLAAQDEDAPLGRRHRSMKNLYGMIPGIKYGWPKNVLHHTRHPANGLRHQRLAAADASPIVDGIDCMEGDGPIMGSPKPMGLLVIGTEPAGGRRHGRPGSWDLRRSGFNTWRWPRISWARSPTRGSCSAAKRGDKSSSLFASWRPSISSGCWRRGRRK